MATVDTLPRFILQNLLTIFNTFLIGITILLSYQSFKFQTRTGIRESLEQLEDIEFNREKLQPILHEMKYRPIQGHITTVQLKYYQFGRNPASASTSHGNIFQQTFYSLNNRDSNDIPENMLRKAMTRKLNMVDIVDDAWIEDTGIFLQYNSGNAVEVRRRTETVLQALLNWHTTNRENFMETFDIDSWSPTEK